MDFRVLFSKMDRAALIDARELGVLICTSRKNIAVMKARGQLPATAFPGRKINRWSVGVIRDWLFSSSSLQTDVGAKHSEVAQAASANMNTARVVRLGRPRKDAFVQGGRGSL